MAACLGKSCSFDLLCVSFVHVYLFFVCVLLSLFGFEGGMWDLIVLIPDHCLPIYLTVQHHKANRVKSTVDPDRHVFLSLHHTHAK